MVALPEPLVATVLAWWLLGDLIKWIEVVDGVVLCTSTQLLSAADTMSNATAADTEHGNRH